MRPYHYVKANPETIFLRQQFLLEKGRKAVSATFLFVGLSLFTYVGGYYYLWTVKETQLAQKPGLGPVLDNAPRSAFIAENSSVKNTSLNKPNEASASDQDLVVYPNFNVSIPTLAIQNATVTTDVISNNEDIYRPVLLKSLAHYKGTAYPGESGNVVVYGHSLLPAFYNPNNYLSIFSRLDTLSAKDKITVKWGKQTFVYAVEGMEVVKPNDTRVIRYNNGKTLTLITCVPPGYTTDRLLVFTRLEE